MRRGKIFSLLAPLAIFGSSAAAMFMAVAISSVCFVDSAYAQCSGSTPVTMTFKNQNPYPVWLGYNADAGTIAPPSGPGGLQLANSGQQPDAGLYVEQR